MRQGCAGSDQVLHRKQHSIIWQLLQHRAADIMLQQGLCQLRPVHCCRIQRGAQLLQSAIRCTGRRCCSSGCTCCVVEQPCCLLSLLLQLLLNLLWRRCCCWCSFLLLLVANCAQLARPLALKGCMW